MKRVWEFIKSHKYAIIWTLCYVATTWAILYFMFDFSIFSAPQWHHLARAQLRGFPGFVFGILVLAALPLYVATTTLIIRTKKPLITIPIPKITVPAFLKPTPAEPTPEPTPESETPTLGPDEVDMPAPLPDDMPAELRFAFIRARNNVGRIQTSAFNALTTTPPQIDTPIVADDTSLPLPTDFDINIPTPDESNAIPTFTEINFDDGDTDQSPSASTPEYTNDNSTLIQHLEQNNIKFTTDENVVITDTHAIITHSDPDFWVTDTENWFAAGRTCPSPIVAIQNAATKHNRTPAIYLMSQNIMNLDKLVPEWESTGITVITDLSDL